MQATRLKYNTYDCPADLRIGEGIVGRVVRLESYGAILVTYQGKMIMDYGFLT